MNDDTARVTILLLSHMSHFFGKTLNSYLNNFLRYLRALQSPIARQDFEGDGEHRQSQSNHEDNRTDEDEAQQENNIPDENENEK